MRRQALENRSTMVRMVVLPWELGRSVMKSMAMCDQGRWGVGKGCNRPAGSSLSDLVVLQTVQSWMNLATSVKSVGHQKRFRRRCSVAVIPGWPELGFVCTWLSRDWRKGSGTKTRSAGHSGGGWVCRLAWVISVIISHWTGARRIFAGRMFSTGLECSTLSVWRDRASAFVFLVPGRVGYSELETGEE